MSRFAHVPPQHRQRRDFGSGARAFNVESYEDKLKEWHRTGKPAWGDTIIVHVAGHDFKRRGWRFWICDHCYAPRSLHPRMEWVRGRALDDNRYLSKNAPHFKEGW